MRISDWSSDVCSSDLVAQREMSLRFQPVVDLRTRKPHHYEVLVRFDGEKSPYEMIKFAESMHLVHEMDLAICESVIQWLGQTQGRGDAVVAVNLSAQSLENDIFVRSEEHTSELQSLMRISYAVFCLKKKKE